MNATSPAGERRPLSPALSEEEIEALRLRLPQRIAVTGATGFLGFHVVDTLVRSGRTPRVLARAPRRLAPEWAGSVEVVFGDLDDEEALGRLASGCDVVVHLAGLVRSASVSQFERVNAAGTLNLVEAMQSKAPSARLVHVSSLAAAGPSVRREGRGPEEEAAPVSAYGRSKLAGEAAARRTGGPWTVLRPPAVYGPRDIDVFQFFRLAAKGMVPIPAGERWVTVAYVGDVVRAVLAAAQGRTDGMTLHLGEPEPVLLPRLVAALATAGGVRARVVPVPELLLRAAGRLGDVLHLLGFEDVAMTSDKASELCARHWSARTADSLAALGIPGTVPFAVGAAETWAWYRRVGWLPRAKMRSERTVQ